MSYMWTPHVASIFVISGGGVYFIRREQQRTLCYYAVIRDEKIITFATLFADFVKKSKRDNSDVSL